MEHCSHRKKLRDLGVFSLEKRRIVQSFTCLPVPKGTERKMGISVLAGPAAIVGGVRF